MSPAESNRMYESATDAVANLTTAERAQLALEFVESVPTDFEEWAVERELARLREERMQCQEGDFV